MHTHDNVSYHVCVNAIADVWISTNAQRHDDIARSWLTSFDSANTITAYRRDLHAFFTLLDLGNIDALTAQRQHVDAYRKTLEDQASSTVARKIAAVSSFYDYALQSRAILTNPARLVRRPKIDPDFSPTQGLTKEQARAFFDAAQHDGPRSYALAALLILTGVRISEALSARLSDLQHDSGHRVLVVTRKGGKRQKVALPPQALEALSVYIGASVADGTEVAMTDVANADAPIFVTATGKCWAASEAFRTIQRLARTAGIEGRVSPHSLRHTHATLALDAGVALADLQDSLGHADPRTTRRYDRARGRLQRSSAYTVAAALA